MTDAAANAAMDSKASSRVHHPAAQVYHASAIFKALWRGLPPRQHAL
jgi:hypothetical protein